MEHILAWVKADFASGHSTIENLMDSFRSVLSNNSDNGVQKLCERAGVQTSVLVHKLAVYVAKRVLPADFANQTDGGFQQVSIVIENMCWVLSSKEVPIALDIKNGRFADEIQLLHAVFPILTQFRDTQ